MSRHGRFELAPGGLGRHEPPDWVHVEKYPLAGLPAALRPVGVPVEFGINWYTNFDQPEKIGDRYWIGRSSNLGSIRGGHAIVTRPSDIGDTVGWWEFYDQGATGECVGFSLARMMSLYNRTRFDAPWTYFAAQDRCGQPHDPEAGTAVRCGLEVLVAQGIKTPRGTAPLPGQGISAYRWLTSVDEVLAALDSPGYDKIGGIPFLNSWGRGFPHVVWMPFATVARLLGENGEAAVATDR